MKFSEPKTYDKCAEFFRSDIKEKLMSIKNTDVRVHGSGYTFPEKYISLKDFIHDAFSWRKTSEGHEFWRKIYYSTDDYLECNFKHSPKKEIYEIF